MRKMNGFFPNDNISHFIFEFKILNKKDVLFDRERLFWSINHEDWFVLECYLWLFIATTKVPLIDIYKTCF